MKFVDRGKFVDSLLPILLTVVVAHPCSTRKAIIDAATSLPLLQHVGRKAVSRRLDEVAFLASGGDGVAKVELTLWAGVSASGAIDGSIEYNRDLFERATVERLAARLSVLAAALADASADADAWSLPLMPAAESELVLRSFDDSAAEYPTELCVHDLVTAQAARTPDALRPAARASASDVVWT